MHGSEHSSCGYGAKYHGLMRCLPSSIISTFFIRVTTSSWCVTMLPDWRGVAAGVSCEASSVSIETDGGAAAGVVAAAAMAAVKDGTCGWGSCDDMDAVNLCVWGAFWLEFGGWMFCSNCCWEVFWLKVGLWVGVEGSEGVDGANKNETKQKIAHIILNIFKS